MFKESILWHSCRMSTSVVMLKNVVPTTCNKLHHLYWKCNIDFHLRRYYFSSADDASLTFLTMTNMGLLAGRRHLILLVINRFRTVLSLRLGWQYICWGYHTLRHILKYMLFIYCTPIENALSYTFSSLLFNYYLIHLFTNIVIRIEDGRYTEYREYKWPFKNVLG